MIVYEFGEEEVQEKYKYSVQSADGTITLVYVNASLGWGIFEYTTGRAVLRDIGILSKKQFIAFTTLIVKLGSREIKKGINKNKKVNGGAEK